jgi:putative NADH-flavin reductase
MQILLIGASCKIVQRILKAALSRRYAVTAAQRHLPVAIYTEQFQRLTTT